MKLKQNCIELGQVKAKFALEQAQRGSRGIALLFF